LVFFKSSSNFWIYYYLSLIYYSYVNLMLDISF